MIRRWPSQRWPEVRSCGASTPCPCSVILSPGNGALPLAPGLAASGKNGHACVVHFQCVDLASMTDSVDT
jgi:hypothetical protein